MSFLAIRHIKLVDLANQLNTMISWLMHVACAVSSVHGMILISFHGSCVLVDVPRTGS